MMSMKLRMLLFTLPMLLLVFFAHLYVYRRWVAPLKHAWLRRGLVGVSVLAALFGFSGRLIGPLFEGEVRRGLMTGAMIWVGFLLYVLLMTIAVGVADGLSKRLRKVPLVDHERRKLLGAGVAFASAGIAGYGVYSAFAPAEITEVTVPIKGLPKALEGFTIAQLSDLHVGAIIQSHFLRDMVARTNAMKADLTVITGDLVDGSVAHLGRYVRELQALQAKRGVYFITGNHDYYSGADAWCEAVRGLGIEVLRNRNVAIAEGLTLAGVDDWSAQRFGEAGYDLDAALQGVDLDRATVLLAHQPANFDVVAARGVGLQLSGHTHGGQLFPVTLGATAVWGERARGLSKALDTHLFVSKGCGFVGPPMRVGSSPEIGKIVLVSA